MVCPSCGHVSQAALRFCGACGAALGPEEAASVRKTVSVVFCDLVGSTALGERTDPEVLRELMSRYHAELRTILERHGGTVEKFVGDAAMAVFGLPQSHEDDALRAVRAAVQAHAAVVRLGLEVRIGINTGEVVAGTGETLATGDAVNVAARLEQVAGPGEILIGSATERLVRGRVRTEEAGPLSLKGKREPVPAFRVLEAFEDIPAFTRPIDAPFVGRGTELETLERMLGTATGSRTPQLATIVGAPGIGKSRLARELVGRAAARILVGRCLSYGDGITYWPLAEIVSQVGDLRTAMSGSDDGDLVADRVETAIGSAETTASPEEIAWGVRRLFERLAAELPLVVVFDDIHWAEPALLDLIEYVAAFAQDVPLLLLCTARADLFEHRPTWATPRPNATLLTLDRLSASDSETLVVLLGRAPPDARAGIVETAEGNPLFVEQLVVMQAEGEGEAGELPPTLQALLTARIDRLTEAERAVAECAAVQGRHFHRGAVATLVPDPQRGEAGTHLLTLVRKELIRPDRGTIPGDDGFRFAHALVRDAAYQAIPKRHRAALHERFADWLAERLGEEAPDEIVGYHLEQAYRYRAELGDMDPALGDRAARRLTAAGQAARSRRDVAAVVSLLGRAAGLVPAGPDRAGLLVGLGEALRLGGETERARSLLEEASSLAAEAGDDHAMWLARIHLATIRLDVEPEGAVEAALREGQAAVASRGPADDHEVLARAWDIIAEAHNIHGQAAEWQRAMERATAHALQTGDLAVEVPIVTHSAGPIVYGPVSVDEGLRYADEVSTRLGHVAEVQGFAQHVRAHMLARRGEFDGAFEAVSAWRRHKRELGQEAMYAQTASCAWDVCSWAQDWERGAQVLREAYEMLDRMGKKAYLSTVAAHLGEAVFRLGRLDEAERLGRQSEQLGASDDRYNETTWRRLMAKVTAARGDLVGAEALARGAVDVAAGGGFLDDAAGAWLDLAEILHAAGRGGATTAADEALALYERKGNLVGAARARSLLDAIPASGG
jgi:class 3 adenylate cyclase/tetratricopeptide (TPR) repeat protein